MESTYSTTQATNLVAIAGVIGMVLSRFHISIGSDEIQLLLAATVSVFGIIANWVQRYKKGDLTLGGFRKY